MYTNLAWSGLPSYFFYESMYFLWIRITFHSLNKIDISLIEFKKKQSALDYL